MAIVAGARYWITRANEAEITFMVADDYQRQGIGTAMWATLETCGAMARMKSGHLLATDASINMKPVILPPGLAKLSTKPLPIRSDNGRKQDRYRPRLALQSSGGKSSDSEQHIRVERYQLLRKGLSAIQVARRPSSLNFKVATIHPTELAEALAKCNLPDFALRIILCEQTQDADAAKPIPLSGVEDNRPNRHDAAEQRNKLAPSQLPHP